MTGYLTPAQLVALDEQAGFNPSQAAIMAATQLGESGGAYGNSVDLNKALAGQLPAGSYPGLANYPQGSAAGGKEISVGPSQINILAHRNVDAARAMSDPLYNAQQAYEISGHGTNFKPWSVFTSGKYAQYLPQTQAAAAGAPPPPPAGNPATPAGFTIPGTGGLQIPNPIDPIDVWNTAVNNISKGLRTSIGKDVVTGIGGLLAPVGQAITRTGLILLGLVFILGSLFILAHAGGNDINLTQPESPSGGKESAAKSVAVDAAEA